MALLPLFQSTRPRGARLYGGLGKHPLCGVSIHAPARGATASRRPAAPAPPGFNPRARAGRDHCYSAALTSSGVFQSTRPRGARHLLLVRVAGRLIVSIHAPARGATGRSCCRRRRLARFNPRARAGRDLLLRCLGAGCGVSIHAPARGATVARLLDAHGAIVSIHAPARGATILHAGAYDAVQVSIHAPARGATPVV